MKKSSTLLVFLLLFPFASHTADSSSNVPTEHNDQHAIKIDYSEDKKQVDLRVAQWSEITQGIVNSLQKDVKVSMFIDAKNLIIDKLWLQKILKNNLARLMVKGDFHITDDALDAFVEDPNWYLDISSEVVGQYFFDIKRMTEKRYGFYNYWAENSNLVNPTIFLEKISQIPDGIYISISDVVPSEATLKFIAEKGYPTISVPAQYLNTLWKSVSSFSHITTNKEITFAFYREGAKDKKSIIIDDVSFSYLPEGPLKFDAVTYNNKLPLNGAQTLAKWQFDELCTGTLDNEITAQDMPSIKHIKLYSWNEHVKKVLLNMPYLEEITIYYHGQDSLDEADFKAFVTFAQEKKLITAYFSSWTKGYVYKYINVGAIKNSLFTKIKGEAWHELVLVDAQINAEAIDVLKKLSVVRTLDLSQSSLTYDQIVEILTIKNFNTVFVPNSLAEHKSILKQQFPHIKISLVN